MLSFGALSLALERTVFGPPESSSVVMPLDHLSMPVLAMKALWHKQPMVLRKTMMVIGLQAMMLVPDAMR